MSPVVTVALDPCWHEIVQLEKYFGNPVPKWFKNLQFTRPARQEARNVLTKWRRADAKKADEFEELFGEPTPFRHRHGAAWEFY